jgi:hypothetical protein
MRSCGFPRLMAPVPAHGFSVRSTTATVVERTKNALGLRPVLT